jgi:hypothetical protein
VSTVTGSSSRQNIESWTPQSLTDSFGADAVSAKYVDGRTRNITFSAGPHGSFHGDQCFGLILEVLRGDKESPIGEKIRTLSLTTTMGFGRITRQVAPLGQERWMGKLPSLLLSSSRRAGQLF